VNARLPATHTAQDEAKLLGQFAALKIEFGLTRPISDRRLAGRPGIAGSPTPFRWTKEDPARVCQRIRWTMGVAHRLPARTERQSNRTRKATGHASRPIAHFRAGSFDAIPITRVGSSTLLACDLRACLPPAPFPEVGVGRDRAARTRVRLRRTTRALRRRGLPQRDP
jgi:hypothetical protein